MNAVGYDLAVPAAQLEEAEFACVSMGVEELNAGGSFKRNDQTVAFIGIAEMGEQDAAEYYEAIQNNVDAAAAAGVDCIILMGAVEDAQALAENVSGMTMIITVGEESDETVLTLGETDLTTEETAEGTEQTEEGEEATEDAAEEAAEEATEAASVLLVTVGASFEGVAVITIDETGVVAGHVDAQALADKGVTADEEIAALEATWLESAAAAASEEEEAEEPDETEESADDEGEETEEPEQTEEPVEAEETEDEQVEEPAAAEESEDEQVEEPVEAEESEDEQVEEPAAADEPEADETAEPETTPADEPAAVSEDEPAADGDGQDEDSQVEDNQSEDGQTEDDPAEDGQIEDSQEDDENVSPTDAVATAIPEETPDTTKKVTFEKGGEDVVIALEHPIQSISANGQLQTQGSGYTLSSDGKTATISGSMLNGWGVGPYYFTFTFSDGTADETVQLTISGEAPATATPEPTAEATATPEPTAEPTATPAPSKGANPNTGDTSPIVLYVVILVVMVAALVVVIVLVIRKNKRK
jgi:chemotaxis protein histidine kinase CheA